VTKRVTFRVRFHGTDVDTLVAATPTERLNGLPLPELVNEFANEILEAVVLQILKMKRCKSSHACR
jgi:hypothetical protein